ncbi:gamma-glutamyl kinase [Rhodobacterales bacterium HKCCSP123]|nr:gamma-glutamyl kinase [Rhodobacterales bacterium HKCCSP123]
MLVFWKARLVVLSVPKTGTTALEEALAPHADALIRNPPEKKHVTARRYRNQLAPFFENRGGRKMETVAVIREPLDWLGSWYRHRARAQIAGSAASTAGLSFERFVEGWLSDPEPEFARVGRQSRFVSDDRGEVMVDHLFRYEAMEEAVSFLAERLDREIDLPRRNVSPRGALALDPVLEARLRREAAADFDLWASLGGA